MSVEVWKKLELGPNSYESGRVVYANQIFLKEIGIRNDKDIVGNFDLRGGLGWSLYLNLF